jgi:hypothetical protein
VASLYNTPPIKISEELDAKFDQTVNIVFHPKRKILIEEEKTGKPLV